MQTLDLETKGAFAVDDAGTVTGLAWPFSSPDQAGDIVRKGAFAGISGTVPMLWQHDPAEIIGEWDRLEETDAGLEVRGRLLIDDVARAREAHALVKKKLLTGLSIGFRNPVATRRPNARGRLLIDDVARAREAHALVKKKLLTGLSIGFRNPVATRRPNARGRIITGLDLAELSLVTFPSHLGARITGAKAAHRAPLAHEVAEIINAARAALYPAT